MISRLSEIVYYKYREVFNPKKTAKAFGYWRPYKQSERIFRMAKTATLEDLKSKKLYFELLKALKLSKHNRCEELLNCVCNCSVYCITKEDFDQHYERLCTEIKKLDVSQLNSYSTEMLICIMLTLGLFSAALILREKYEEQIITNGTALEKYSVYFQNGQFEKALDLLEKSEFFRIYKYAHPRSYNAMKKSILPIVHPEMLDVSSKFAEYLQGKKIYIIGPSDNGNPIDIAEEERVVIRYAYMGKNNVGGYYSTIPTNVSYYNGMHATTVASMNDSVFLTDLTFAVLKYKLESSFWNNLEGMLPVRYVDKVPYTMQHGVSPNMLQIVLIDLLHFGKLDITVLDNNLYLNRRYTEGYASNQVQKRMDDFAFANQFAKHDVFCNFKFTRSLFKQGVFSADLRLEEILNMSCEQFAEAMECEYGHKQVL